MNTWLIISLLVALGIIVGNIMLLKYSAKMKFEKPKKSLTPSSKKDDSHNDSLDDGDDKK
ncbi:MAG: hypothetical protein Alis3KO_03640 [Aliiglaciecola sp.]